MEFALSQVSKNSLENGQNDDGEPPSPSEENINNQIIIVNEYTYISSADSLFHQELVFSNDKDRRIDLEYDLPLYKEDNSTIITTTERDKLKEKLDS